jgi:hypothetical protein
MLLEEREGMRRRRRKLKQLLDGLEENQNTGNINRKLCIRPFTIQEHNERTSTEFNVLTA